MSTSPAQEMKLKQFETTVTDFCNKLQGQFIVASMDTTFHRILRSTISKQLGVVEDCIHIVQEEGKILKVVKALAAKSKQVLLFIERVLNDKETSFLIKQIKEAFSNVKVIILATEAERQRLVLLHEIGADNFINKPISINTLIEKIAFTIKPQGKIGKLIDGAKSMVERGSFTDAIKIADKILEMKPGSAAGLLVKGDAYRGLGDKAKAKECYIDATKEAKLYLEPLKKLAQFFGEEGDLEGQLEYLKKLDKLSPLNLERKVDMGGLHVELGDEDSADQLFDVALAQAKKEAMTMIGDISAKIGNIYAKKNPEKAEAFYRKALKARGNMLNIEDIKTFTMLGIALRRQGKWREAITEYEKAIRISPEDENLYYNKAMAYAEGKQFDNAVDMLQKTLELNPRFHTKDPVLSYNLGLIYARAKKRNQARVFLENSLKLNPDFQSPRKLLATL